MEIKTERSVVATADIGLLLYDSTIARIQPTQIKCFYIYNRIKKCFIP